MKLFTQLSQYQSQHRLTYRLLGLLVFIGFLLTLLSTGIQSYLDYRQELKALDQQMEEIRHSYLESISNSLWSFDQEGLRLQMQGILNLPGIKYLKIETSLGESYAIGTPPPKSITISRTFQLYHDKVFLGSMQVHASEEDIFQHLRRQIANTILLETLRIFLVAVAIFFAVQWLITRHLMQMADYARKFEINKLNVPLVLERAKNRAPDELDQVVNAINEMRLSLIEGLNQQKHYIEEKEKTRQQQEQLEILKQTDAMKDQFLSILSHELRTPINVISGFGSILDDEIAGSLNEQQHEYLRKMLGSADNLILLVNDLLDMTRIQAGKFTVLPHIVNFPEIVESVIENLTPLADRKHQALINEVPSELPQLMADDQRIAQVLNNLINNSIKFTPEGGNIWVRSCQEGNHLRCEVTDSGIGIAKEDIPKLFKRFTQLDMTSTRKVGGTGLGLSISKAIIDAHGGEIGVESEWGKGSTFWFTLPLPSQKAGEPS